MDHGRLGQAQDRVGSLLARGPSFCPCTPGAALMALVDPKIYWDHKHVTGPVSGDQGEENSVGLQVPGVSLTGQMSWSNGSFRIQDSAKSWLTGKEPVPKPRAAGDGGRVELPGILHSPPTQTSTSRLESGGRPRMGPPIGAQPGPL